MQCYNCKHDFCWMCLGDWKAHGSEYYECSRYKENPNIAHESVHAQAREALKKYLHYYERVSFSLSLFPPSLSLPLPPLSLTPLSQNFYFILVYSLRSVNVYITFCVCSVGESQQVVEIRGANVRRY